MFKYLSSSRKKQWRDTNRNSSSSSKSSQQRPMSITIDGMKSTSITTSSSTTSNSSRDYEEEMHVTKTDKEKDILIQQLQEAMEREQKIQDERVIMLQIQIERLIEMRSKSCGSSTLQTPRDIALNEDDKHQHALIEISALNELLSRVLGERDVLSVKVRNLERLIKEMATRTKIDHGDIIYQLTCKKCKDGSIHVIGKTSQDLKSTVKKHYKEVYLMVERYKEDDEGEGNEDTNEYNNGSAFMQSSFATHVVKHIINQSQGSEQTKKKVFEWCQRNIRVESFSIDLC